MKDWEGQNGELKDGVKNSNLKFEALLKEYMDDAAKNNRDLLELSERDDRTNKRIDQLEKCKTTLVKKKSSKERSSADKEELHFCAPLSSSVMQAGVCLRQDTEKTLPELTEQHRIRQNEEELSGLESVHMAESETDCAAPGLNALEPECVTAQSGVSDVHQTRTSLIKTETDLGSTHTGDLIKEESLDFTKPECVTHLHPGQIKMETDDGGDFKPAHLRHLHIESDKMKCESSGSLESDLMNPAMNGAAVGCEVHSESRLCAGEPNQNCKKEEIRDQPIDCGNLHCGIKDENNQTRISRKRANVVSKSERKRKCTDGSFEDSSDSGEDCDWDEDDLFLRGIDPVVDALDEEDDDDDWEPPHSSTLTQPRKKRRALPEVSVPHALSGQQPGTSSSSSSLPPPPWPSRTTINIATQACTLKPTSPGQLPRTSRTAAARSAQRRDGQNVKWLEKDDPDRQPPQHKFLPRQIPGPTVTRGSSWSPLQLFKLFFHSEAVNTLVNNTNKMACKIKAAGKKFEWKPVSEDEFYTFLSVIIFCGLVRCPTKEDYWRQLPPYNFRFPASVMSRNRFNAIFWCLHLSDPDEDEENDRKKGTPQYDRLFKVKPLYNDISVACKASYQPDQKMSVDERMLATNAKLGFKLKPTKWGIKLFVLADMHGYTWNFFIYEGKTAEQMTDGLGYSAVMRLLETPLLGTGYQVFMNNFYTSPKLLMDMDRKQIMGCGTMREGRRGFPTTRENRLEKRAKRGDIRWLRVEKLLFVQWMDTKRVTVASNFHKAFSGLTASRRVRDDAGNISGSDIPVPDAVKDYNTHVGAVDLSDALMGYYNVLQRTTEWFKQVFYHMVDIAVVNSYIIYKQLQVERGETPVTHKGFRELLITQMATQPEQSPPQPAPEICGPIYPLRHSTKGRRNCVLCKNRTPVICRKCNTPLCLTPKRNCYIEWHDTLKS